MPKLIRITTVPLSLKLLLSGQMKYMKTAGWDVQMVSADGKEVNEVIAKEGCEHQSIPFTRQITPLQDLVCLWKLYQFLKSEQPDIVHTHTPKAGLLGMLAAKLAGVKTRIHTVAGLPYVVTKDNKRKMLENAERWTFKYATHVWPNSLSLKSFIEKEQLARPEKLEVLGNGSSNGVDLVRFSRENLKENHLVAATMRVMPGENDFIILAVGRLVKDKGIQELVEAFLKSRIVNKSKLVLLGDYEQHLDPVDEDVIRKIEDHPRIVQVSWSDHVEHYLAISDVLVHASHREGFPNVILEAGAMQVPVICSDIPGNTDIVRNKKTGLVFPVKSVSVLKDALEFAYVKRESMQVLADTLYKEVVEKFDRRRMHALILEKYHRLTGHQ
ncbi:glycosyltransferase family 1 protein [Echinicola strongylocentroti]|uniref:Glycosyltransferase family 1 protein n=1 Tax=Echinicola strongylocentroti TaxID=1795355 RepID=A0A2Z4IDM4_9BACT|nr:glycosyltransferase family 4 protein [Echinicola strongylocentroti]AWW29132.1 glycosyltransferase family 1 protein [Echinicola strongylocentroti]